MIYYTADLHLGHKNIIQYENRPYQDVEEMDTALIANWNSVVNNEDEVYVLGDFCFKGATKAIEYLEQLNGRICLIRGNHDHFMSQDSFIEYLYSIDDKLICLWDYAHVTDGPHNLVLCHYPILHWEGKEQGWYHLYGHVHSYRDCSAMGDHSYNVGVDVRGLKPVTLDELIAGYRDEISLCPHCGCMTHTMFNGTCGKCKEKKNV